MGLNSGWVFFSGSQMMLMLILVSERWPTDHIGRGIGCQVSCGANRWWRVVGFGPGPASAMPGVGIALPAFAQCRVRLGPCSWIICILSTDSSLLSVITRHGRGYRICRDWKNKVWNCPVYALLYGYFSNTLQVVTFQSNGRNPKLTAWTTDFHRIIAFFVVCTVCYAESESLYHSKKTTYNGPSKEIEPVHTDLKRS